MFDQLQQCIKTACMDPAELRCAETSHHSNAVSSGGPVTHTRTTATDTATSDWAECLGEDGSYVDDVKDRVVLAGQQVPL